MIDYKSLPESPGVYLFIGDNERVLYVGKAKNLRSRVSSYFTGEQAKKTALMLSKAESLKHLVTNNEVEALLLECSLIKNNKPFYNVRLKDDKSYPQVRITDEDYPRVFITRRIINDGSEYFGPFTNSFELKKSVRFIRGLLGLRACSNLKPQPCLNYHMKRCLGPCTGRVSRDEYLSRVALARKFLQGRHESVITELRKRLESASSQRNYELAVILRDNIKAVESIVSNQRVFFNEGDFDVLSPASLEQRVGVMIFFVRAGKVSGSEFFILNNAHHLSDGEVLSDFIKLFYYKRDNNPRELVVSELPPDSSLISEAFNFKLRTAKRGRLTELLNIVRSNALESIKQDLLNERSRSACLYELRDALSLKRAPRIIEGVDVSNISGAFATGSIVRFKDGLPSKNHYRRYRITSEGPDDYGMMREVIHRRFKGELDLPDLLLIDGGRGQLNACLDVLGELKLSLPCVAIAKSFEHLFIKGLDSPIILPGNSSALRLLQRVRDEAHRFAVAYHKLLRSKSYK